MLINSTVVITSQCICISSHHVYTLNIYNYICQLYLNKACENTQDQSPHHREVSRTPLNPGPFHLLVKLLIASNSNILVQKKSRQIKCVDNSDSH